MLSDRSAAMAAEYPRPGPAAAKNAVIEAFIQHSAFMARVTCAAFEARATRVPYLAAGG
jgi:hypothetical protein